MLITMWVYGEKTNEQGEVIRFKARLVARGDRQHVDVNFVDTFAPVARMASCRLFVALSALVNLEIYSCDINTAYLNAAFQYPQFVNRMQGHVNYSSKSFIMRKALYGLRQSERAWNTEFDRLLQAQDF